MSALCRPRKARPACARIAKIMAKVNWETMIGISFGSSSTSTIRQRGSSRARAAST